MTTIIRGTTPTIRIVFSAISVDDIEIARLFVKQGGATKITKGLDEAASGDSYLEWPLTQAETLGLAKATRGTIVLDWVLGDGTRGRSKECKFYTGEPGEAVIYE